MKKILLLVLLVIIGLFTITGCDKEKKTKLVEGKDYTIDGEFDGKYLDLTQRGYYIDTLNEPNAPYFYIICMGEQTTGGYSLEIKDVNKVEDKTEVIVKENKPGKNSVVTDALTTPTIMIEFPEMQKNIVIKNTAGEEFKQLEA